MPDFQSSPELSPDLPGPGIDPASSSVAQLRQAMAEGQLTATALTQHFLSRIEGLDPALHALITVSQDAMAEAAASDRAWASGKPRGPLEGIPVLIKDNVQAAGMPTTAGSPALLAAWPPDAFIVTRLRAAGARGGPAAPPGRPVRPALPECGLRQRARAGKAIGRSEIRKKSKR